MPLLKQEYHRTIYLFFLLVFAASLPLSKFFMSLALWMLALNWFLGGQYREKLTRLWQNKAAVVFLGLFFMHVIGMIWSADLEYALKDVRVKLPLLVLPFIIASEAPLRMKHFRLVLLGHAVAVVAGSLFIIWRMYVQDISDPREASLLISHIRFALNVCMAVFSLAYLIIKKDKTPGWLRITMGILLLWLLVFLFILQSFTGLVIFSVVGLILLIRAAYLHSGKSVKWALSVFILLLCTAVSVYAVHLYKKNFRNDAVDPGTLEYFTPDGNKYVHNLQSRQTENGQYLWLYVCEPEMEAAWNKRSEIAYDSTDRKNHHIRNTLIRFLASKGCRKDAGAVNSLTEEEVTAVENGIPNVNDLHDPGFMRRIENVFWEIGDYFHTGDPRNHSLMQRVELWKASLAVIGEHPVAGVGTGDVPVVFAAKLKEINSPLQQSSMRSHNQFLAIAIAFGIPGLILFLVTLFYPAIKAGGFRNYFFLAFFLIAFLSMITEDTIESQPGVSFFAFFYVFLLFAYPPETHENIPENVS